MIKTNRTGEVQLNNFGSTMEIVAYRKYSDIDVFFSEYNWTAKHVSYGQFKKGMLKCPYEPRTYGKGYLGEGPYETRENGELTKKYSDWKDMLKRAYSNKYHEKQPSYIDCEVADEWLNFQNFAAWHEENWYEVPNQRVALDKDILIKNNKTYSPDTARFVPASVNSLFVKNDAARGNLPVGVCYEESKKKYRARCRIGSGKQKFLGHFDNETDAFLAYKQFKEAYIKKVANDYLDVIPFDVYQAMINYEVEIDD